MSKGSLRSWILSLWGKKMPDYLLIYRGDNALVAIGRGGTSESDLEGIWSDSTVLRFFNINLGLSTAK